ncbi:MAG: pantoate--beta-alanine ligase [Desulfobacteraceae bacterium]|nr:pantoate--beta-alanine ligase [Desulfobacteraceae bacterium]
MEIIRSPAAMTAWSNRTAAEGKAIALVPTMGFFHEGHLSLMRSAARQAGAVVVSLFVNPIQFGPAEDLDRYPRDFERDSALAAREQVDALFAPEAAAMYPEGFQTRIAVTELSQGLCGAGRPGHFEGVATVVAKLFHIVRPQVAIFGEKDFQQLAIIRRLVRDLDLDVEIVGQPIVREADGLAMSSRNAYLSAAERQSARCLSRALRWGRELAAGGETDAGRLRAALESMLAADPTVTVEYVAVVHETTLRPQQQIDRHSRLALAVKIGRTRLIDNGLLFAPEQG